MMRAFAVIALGATTLAAPVAQACDPDEVNHLLTGVCQGALGEAAAVAEALLPRAGAAEAARLARLVGRIEARLGEAPPIWPRQQAGLAR